MQRRIQTDAMAASFGAGTLFLVTAGFLENAGIGQVDPSWVGTGMLILWGIISTVQRFRYRGESNEVEATCLQSRTGMDPGRPG